MEAPYRQLMILFYAIMISLGTAGNLLVIYVVARNPGMRTARNVYVVNLAISDLMLCLITMPLTLIEILFLTWQFGNNEVGFTFYSHPNSGTGPFSRFEKVRLRTY